MSAIPNSRTTTSYGTVVERYLDTNGNYPVVRRKYIPSEGSKFRQAGIESITRFRSPSPDCNNTYSVVRKGVRKSYSQEGLKKLFKDLNIQNIIGHKAKEYLGSTMKQIIKQIKKGKL